MGTQETTELDNAIVPFEPSQQIDVIDGMKMVLDTSTHIFKRPRSSTTTSSNNQKREEIEQTQTKPKQKKIKKADQEKENYASVSDVSLLLDLARDTVLSNSKKYPLDFNNIASFIFETQGKRKNEYTPAKPPTDDNTSEISSSDENIPNNLTENA